MASWWWSLPVKQKKKEKNCNEKDGHFFFHSIEARMTDYAILNLEESSFARDSCLLSICDDMRYVCCRLLVAMMFASFLRLEWHWAIVLHAGALNKLVQPIADQFGWQAETARLLPTNNDNNNNNNCRKLLVKKINSNREAPLKNYNNNNWWWPSNLFVRNPSEVLLLLLLYSWISSCSWCCC